MFDKDLIEKLKSSVDIVELVGRYVNLQKSGSYYRGLCPFHNDTDPSFYVSPGKGFFHCFGCGASGDVISFYQKIENLSFTDAVVQLADMFNVNVPMEAFEETAYHKSTKILENLARYWHNELFKKNKTSQNVINYLKSRKITGKTIRSFELGLSTGDRTLERFIQSNNKVKRDDLVSAGVAYFSKGNLINRFSDRLTIPIRNKSGKVVGFGARVISDENGPKYLNSPESSIFKKSKLLFNLNRAKKSIDSLNYVIVVEGFFDVISLYEAGIENVVGTLGTSLTGIQLKLLKNITENILFFFDSDEAGQKATFRAVEMAEQLGLSTAVVQTPKFKDPGELLVKKEPKDIRNILNQAVPGPTFKIHYFSRKLDLKNDQGKKKLLQISEPYLRKYQEQGDNPGLQTAVKAISELTGYEEESINVSSRRKPFRKNVKPRSGEKKLKPGEKELLNIYFSFPEYKSLVLKTMELLPLSSACMEIYKLIEKDDDFERILKNVEEDLGRELMNIVETPMNKNLAEVILNDLEKRTEKMLIKEQIKELDRKINQVSNEKVKTSLLMKRVQLSRLLLKSQGGGNNGS
ncbi:MAG: DNA primase [Thermotogota bacterium]|nr:DNA primase [Thermotogota bacterium]